MDKDIVTDGKSLYQSEDPPSHRCVYILPGNARKEVYRLLTFSRFPYHVPVDPVLLARSGFFYTGYKDRVKCFSCANCVEDWTITDDVTSRDWHGERCAFLSRTDHGNIPIQIFRNPTVILNMPTTSQYTPQLEPQQHNASHQNTLTVQAECSPVTNYNESELRRSFPCQTPTNPHMRNTYDRLQTFLNSRYWPRERVRAMPQQFAEAGLYYLGNRDRVRCWYCNGGLQNWEETDEPWFEHAKWYPECDFVLQSKGPSFVATVIEQFPNLVHPSYRMPDFMNYENSTADQENNKNVIIIDPRQDIKQLERKIDNDMMTSHLVEEARVMGFTDLHIRKALQKEYETSTLPFENFRDLVDALLSISMSEINTSEDEMNSTETKPHEPPLSRAYQELKDLEKSRLCGKCHAKPSSVLLLPCGHLVCCVKCSENVKKCPLCRRDVKEKIRSYIV